MAQSTATQIAAAIADDLSDWYVERDVEDVDVGRDDTPIYDMGSKSAGIMYVTIYESDSTLERATRTSNRADSIIQIGVQKRYGAGGGGLDEKDQLRYELEQIAERYFGVDVQIDGKTIRASSCVFGAVNDPTMTVQQNSYFGVVEMTFRDRTRP
jgi:hypothetical protein